jgi:hypothetical protein
MLLRLSAALAPLRARTSGIVLRVRGEHEALHLHLVPESVREQRADRAVREAHRDDLLRRRAAFSLEEAAGDLAGRVRLLPVVDGQREEVDAGPGRGR